METKNKNKTLTRRHRKRRYNHRASGWTPQRHWRLSTDGKWTSVRDSPPGAGWPEQWCNPTRRTCGWTLQCNSPARRCGGPTQERPFDRASNSRHGFRPVQDHWWTTIQEWLKAVLLRCHCSWLAFQLSDHRHRPRIIVVEDSIERSK